MTIVRPGFESERLLRAGFVGCGDHSVRNVFPALQYCPIDLVAVCDLDAARAAHVGRAFGARQVETDHRRLLDLDLDVVFVVTGYARSNGAMRNTHAPLAAEFLAAGIATWIEKPPANDLDGIEQIRTAQRATGATFAVGYKKAFTPAATRAHALMQRAEFGELRTMTARYPQPIPPVADLPGGNWSMAFLDHLSHPISLIRRLGGPTRSVSYIRTDDGTGFMWLQLESGAVASLHLGPYTYRPNLGERTELNGLGASITVENNVRVTWIPAGDVGPYGKAADYTEWEGVTQWEPEFSLGQLYNKGLFLIGYQPEISHFCDAVLAGRDVEIGGLDYAEEHLRVFHAVARGPGVVVELSEV